MIALSLIFVIGQIIGYVIGIGLIILILLQFVGFYNIIFHYDEFD